MKRRVKCPCGKLFWSKVVLGVPVDILCRTCENGERIMIERAKKGLPCREESRVLRRMKKYRPNQYTEYLLQKEKRKPNE